MNLREIDALLTFLPKEIVEIIYDYYFETSIFCTECNRHCSRLNNCLNCQWTLSWHEN